MAAKPAAPNIGQEMVTIDNLAQFLNENRHGFHAMAEMELLCYT